MIIQSTIRKANRSSLFLIQEVARFSTTYDSKNDFYVILGVNPKANDKEMKKAYYKLAQKYHPDKAPGFEDKFKSVNNAYECLKDETTRTTYDRLREEFKNPSAK